MHVVPCDAPVGQMEPAPITSLPVHIAAEGETLEAFWADDDRYLLRASGTAGERWFAMDAGIDTATDMSEADRLALGALLADILPMGGGRVAFPFGTTGRQVYRVWRGPRGKAGATGRRRTTILGVRAARSHRQPA
ncbi:MAG: hypothetical protein LCH84_19150 [Gemmatimonadetes bacterium]|nr:hypothetical protein [Gemmatimonadota bacterium]